MLGILFLFLVWREIETWTRRRSMTVRSLDNGGEMATLWFMIVAVMVAAYVVLDGFDLGAGVIYLIAGARPTTNAAWCCAPSVRYGTATKSGCWPPAARFTLPFPQLYASSFSGFYLPLMMVLWLLMLRAIGIEFRTHIENPVWQEFLRCRSSSVSSALLAIFFGAALGNVIRGVPLDAEGYFFEPLWTNFRLGAQTRHSRLVHRDGGSRRIW